jgi:ribosome-associated protein
VKSTIVVNILTACPWLRQGKDSNYSPVGIKYKKLFRLFLMFWELKNMIMRVNSANKVLVNSACSISMAEISLSFSRSSGPGGQNVNKVNSRVTLAFNVFDSPSLSDNQRQLVMNRLSGRINRRGILQISSDTTRTQAGNREEVVSRFVKMMRRALFVQPPRRKTRAPRRAKERRLEVKKNRGRVKKLRSRRVDEEW